MADIAEERLSICRKCIYYQEGDRCGYLIEHTGKRGYLKHSTFGVSNLKARCPNKFNRQWYSIPSYHAWYINTKYMKLGKDRLHRLTMYGIGNVLDLASDIYNYIKENNPESSVNLHDIFEDLTNVKQTPNDYRYL